MRSPHARQSPEPLTRGAPRAAIVRDAHYFTPNSRIRRRSRPALDAAGRGRGPPSPSAALRARPPFRGLASQALPPGPWLTLDTPRCTSALWSRPIIFLRLFPVCRSQRHRHLLRKPPRLASPEQPPGPAVARDVPVCIWSQPRPPRARAVRMRPRAQPAKQAPQGRGAASAQRPLQSHA